MKKAWIAVIAVVALAVIGFFLFMPKAPDISRYEHLKSPEMAKYEKQKMLVAELKGKPEETSGKAFKALFGVYYSLKDVSKKNMPGPRARWPEDKNIPMDQWTGVFGIPVPAEVKELPEQKGDIKVELKTWDYGDVVEILHIGPYDKEEASVAKLADEAKLKGFKLKGSHEEEYLIGPWIPMTSPAKYATIIRYQVEKAGKTPAKGKAPAKDTKTPSKDKGKKKGKN
jgi:hypothetical protein